MVLTASSALFPVNGLCCHRRRPQCASIVADLMPASRHQNHTASPSAGPRIRLMRRPRPPHPAPNVRDDRDTPLVKRVQDVRTNAADLRKREAKYFLLRGLPAAANQPEGTRDYMRFTIQR